MGKRIKIIIAVVITAVVISIGGYYAYPKYDLNKRMQASDKIMKEKKLKTNNTDKAIVSEILKSNTKIEYAYISHNDEDVILNLMFHKGIDDNDKVLKTSEYMSIVRKQYKGKGKNISATIIPNN
ncbi:hypothetical protein [Clostridium tagluense]|uniref:Uncharacterized protein n=1 Tax=Clostridium tagluense TaxID=360422 RepID=A0A401UJL9_9CLOT|nr:hypothetical protein [Clostridium tagluense]GCD09747.1 hypothetical protein Ctaglu_13700 [Clostridium tagluense]